MDILREAPSQKSGLGSVWEENNCDARAVLATVTLMIRTEGDLLDALRRRCDELRVSHRVLDNVAKFTDGYTGKLLCRPPIKRLNTRSLFWFLDAIGCSLHLVETQTAADLQQRFPRDWEVRPERYTSSDARHEPIRRVISRNFLRKIGRLGNIAYAKKCRAERIRKRKISRINRANALKRWRRPQTTEVGPANASS